MINHPSSESPYWMEMVQYLTQLADSHISRTGVRRALLNKETKPGRGFQDYNRTLQRLIDEGAIVIDDGNLTLGLISEISWIKEGLEAGNEEIWDLAEKIEPNLEWVRKYDNTALLETGLKGEKAVINLLHQEIDVRYHNRIKHVALVNDYAGFDIGAPSIKNHEVQVFLEVKSTVRPETDFTFYLSRNEFNVGNKKRNWLIVCVKIKNDQPIILGHLYLDQIRDLLPVEINEQVKWQSLKITIPISLIHQGLY